MLRGKSTQRNLLILVHGNVSFAQSAHKEATCFSLSQSFVSCVAGSFLSVIADDWHDLSKLDIND